MLPSFNHFALLALLAVDSAVATPLRAPGEKRMPRRSSACKTKTQTSSGNDLAAVNSTLPYTLAHHHHKNHTSHSVSPATTTIISSGNTDTDTTSATPTDTGTTSSETSSGATTSIDTATVSAETTSTLSDPAAPSTTAAPSPSDTPAPDAPTSSDTPASAPSDTPSPAPQPAAPSSPQVGIAWSSDSGGNIASFTGASNSKLRWYYNWAATATDNMGSLEFVPMVWGPGSVGDVQSASSGWNGVTHILSFNEPDQSTGVGGSGMAAGDAAGLHQQWVSSVGGSYQIGSPAVARGGGQWLDDFLSACNGQCKVDFIPFHFYGTSAQDLISYAQGFKSKYNKPLWLTEWACQDYSSGQICSAEDAQSFMDTAISAFRNDPSTGVDRWAYFGAFASTAAAGNGNALEDGSGAASPLGAHYVAL